MTAIQYVTSKACRDTGASSMQRAVPEETAVAFVYNGTAHAVMMATPLNLEDFARGFTLTEGIVSEVGQIQSIEAVPFEEGIELRMWIDEDRMAQLRARRRRMAGPTGCGLCGIESLTEAMRPVTPVQSEARFFYDDILAAVRAIEFRQELHKQTRAMHGAGLWNKQSGLVCLREDVGRHNALDKLMGASSLDATEIGESLVVLTSRVSIELVTKAARLGVPLLVAISAPTALAIRTAEKAGITLAAIARDDGFEVFACSDRVEKQSAEGSFLKASFG